MRTTAAGSLWTRIRWWSSGMCYHWRRARYDLCDRYGLPRICAWILDIAYLAKFRDRGGMVDCLRRSRLYRYRERTCCWLWKRCNFIQNQYRARRRGESRKVPGCGTSSVRDHVERWNVSPKTGHHLIMQYIHLERLVLHSQGERQRAAVVGQCFWVL